MSALFPVNLSVEAETGEPLRVLLIWPPEEDELQHQVQAYVLMRRPQGVLLVFPDHVIEEDSFMPFCLTTEEGREPLVGPFQRFRVPLLTVADGGGLSALEEQGSVMVMDMSLPGAHSVLMSFPEGEEEIDLINHFAHTDSEARPDFQALIDQVKIWLQAEGGEQRLVFTLQQRRKTSSHRAHHPKFQLGPELLCQMLLHSPQKQAACQKLEARNQQWHP